MTATAGPVSATAVPPVVNNGHSFKGKCWLWHNGHRRGSPGCSATMVAGGSLGNRYIASICLKSLASMHAISWAICIQMSQCSGHWCQSHREDYLNQHYTSWERGFYLDGIVYAPLFCGRMKMKVEEFQCEKLWKLWIEVKHYGKQPIKIPANIIIYNLQQTGFIPPDQV